MYVLEDPVDVCIGGSCRCMYWRIHQLVTHQADTKAVIQPRLTVITKMLPRLIYKRGRCMEGCMEERCSSKIGLRFRCI
jgi:hypothetical protein